MSEAKESARKRTVAFDVHVGAEDFVRIGESGGDDFGDSRGEGQIGRRELVRGAEVAEMRYIVF